VKPADDAKRPVIPTMGVSEGASVTVVNTLPETMLRTGEPLTHREQQSAQPVGKSSTGLAAIPATIDVSHEVYEVDPVTGSRIPRGLGHPGHTSAAMRSRRSVTAARLAEMATGLPAVIQLAIATEAPLVVDPATGRTLALPSRLGPAIGMTKPRAVEQSAGSLMLSVGSAIDVTQPRVLARQAEPSRFHSAPPPGFDDTPVPPKWHLLPEGAFFANGIWTPITLPADLAGIDVACGEIKTLTSWGGLRREPVVWVLARHISDPSKGALVRVSRLGDVQSYELDDLGLSSVSITRISASRMDASVALISGAGSYFVDPTNPILGQASGPALDIGACGGSLGDPDVWKAAPGPGPSVYRLGWGVKPGGHWPNDAILEWDADPKYTGAAHRMALGEISSASYGTPWVVGTDGSLFRRSVLGDWVDMLGGQDPAQVSDAGVGADDRAWILGTTPAPAALVDGVPVASKGFVLWRWDEGMKLWRREAPGWGVAIDVDASGNPWVLDANGALWVRGACVAAVFPWIPEKPQPHHSDPIKYPQDDPYWGKAQSLPLLFERGDEVILRSRELGAGGMVWLARWDHVWDDATHALKTDANIGNLPAILPKYLSAEFKLLFNAAVFFSGLRALPATLDEYVRNNDHWEAAVASEFSLYLDVLSSTFPALRDASFYFSVGNEVDLTFNNLENAMRNGFFESYVAFYENAVDEIHKRFPNAQVGVTVTLDWLYKTFGPSRFQQLNAKSDVLIVTYYPKTKAGLQKLMEFVDAHGKPTVVQEIGFVSTGGQAEQATFVGDTLTAWRSRGLKMPFLSWFNLHDYLLVEPHDYMHDPTELDGSNPAGVGNAVPLEFGLDPQSGMSTARLLSYCGLRDSDGNPKQGWHTMATALKRWRVQDS
jgi:hypothetical protein